MNMTFKKANMVRALPLSLIFATAFSVSAPAFAQASAHGQHAMGTKTTQDAGKSSMAMHAAMDDMSKKMKSMTMTGHQDMDFAMMMVAHHQAAIDMAQAQVNAGKDAKMIKAAKKIIADQKKEIAMFEAWMKKHPHTK